MTIIQAIILGIVQGLTEFLPISSSGHLVLVPHLFGWDIPEDQAFSFLVLVQLGTLVAVIIYYWQSLLAISRAFVQGLIQRRPFADPEARIGWLLIIATIPAGLAGFFLESLVEATVSDPIYTGFFLFGTAALLVMAERIGGRDRSEADLTGMDALVIGLFQVLALFPGLSRSGSVISGGMTRNLMRPSAARFSFLMAVPIMVAAGAKSLLDLGSVADLGSFLPALTIGFIVSLIVGYLSIRWLLAYLARGSLYGFAIYVCLVGAATIVVNL
jgi:undecaprenyl-diphosphatase